MSNTEEDLERLRENTTALLNSISEDERKGLIARTQLTMHGLRRILEDEDVTDTALSRVCQAILIVLSTQMEVPVGLISTSLEQTINSYALCVAAFAGAYDIEAAPEELITAAKEYAVHKYGPNEEEPTIEDIDLTNTGQYL